MSETMHDESHIVKTRHGEFEIIHRKDGSWTALNLGTGLVCEFDENESEPFTSKQEVLDCLKSHQWDR